MAKGDHIFVPLCGLLSHHGIEIGDGTVVHWCSGHEGTKHLGNKLIRKADAQIRRTSMEEFCQGATPKVRKYTSCAEPDEVVKRALSRVGESGYHLLWNNCEHFATWCKTSRSASAQVDAVERQVIATGMKIVAQEIAPKTGSTLAAKPLSRGATPWLLIADGAQLVTELVAMNWFEQKPEDAKKIGQAVGCLGSVGIGAATGGPVGAVAALACWGMGEIFGELFS